MGVDRVILKSAKDGQFYWIKVAANNEVVSLSESYTRKDDARQAAEREARAADLDGILDETEVGDAEG